jgi:hypothetical protein
MNVASAEDFIGGGASANRVGGALSHGAVVDSQRSIAEIQSAIAVAKRFPRDPVDCLRKIEMACARPTLAERAIYSFPRGKETVSGPSIRLAEVLAQCWGNMKVGFNVKESNDDRDVVEAFCWDVENNFSVTKVFTVQHVRHTKSGTYKLTDPRDQYENDANQAMRRVRACILSVIPGDILEAAVSFCQRTLETKCDVGPEAQKKLLQAFREIGVSRDMIEAFLGRRVESIMPTQMVRLRQVFASIRDEVSSVADWFTAEAPKGDGSGSGSGEPKVDPTAEALTSGKGSTPERPTGKKEPEAKGDPKTEVKPEAKPEGGATK